MTIKGIKKLLKEKHGHIFRSLSMYKFKGCKIAIDCSDLAYTYWSPQQNIIISKMADPVDDDPTIHIETRFLNMIWGIMNKFINLNIVPVMVFDGKPPDEKKAVIEERSNNKKINKKKIEEYKAELRKIPQALRTTEQLDKLKTMLRSYNLLSENQYSLLKVFFNGLGIPVLQAKNEAEELCCTLCREGYVSAVYCGDSDCLAHLAPCWIFDKSDKKTYVAERNEYMEEFEFVLLKDVLKVLDLNKESFIDLCIMSGCDYNDNIPNVAAGNSYKKLKIYKSIEEVIKHSSYSKLDIDNLKYQGCRKLFAKRSYCECCDKPDYQLNIDRNCYNEYSHDYLFKCNMSHVIDVIRFVYPNYPMEAVKIDFDILFPEEKVEEASMVKFTIDMSKLQL